MNNPLLSGLVDYANGLRDNLSHIAVALLNSSPALLYESLDSGLSSKVAQTILARLFNVLHDRFDIRQLVVTPSLNRLSSENCEPIEFSRFLAKLQEEISHIRKSFYYLL